MDRYEVSAQLEWWANPLTCLADFPVRVSHTHGPDTWHAAVSPPLTGEIGEGAEWLIALDPWFTLRFADDSTIEVEVTHSGDVNDLRLVAIEDRIAA
ncbi:hypothetical protein [Embleya sp. AB8]|uniref:hypothetical protein n=1 Tax=Embleya sp. AB8 TaxID=3156304 RepID=UPI003C71C895